MPILVTLLALLAPRLIIALLYLFSGWFNGVFVNGIIWPILGFLFFPFTMLWFSAVQNWSGGEWTVVNIIVMVIAVFMDLGGYSTLKK